MFASLAAEIERDRLLHLRRLPSHRYRIITREVLRGAAPLPWDFLEAWTRIEVTGGEWWERVRSQGITRPLGGTLCVAG